ncbi:conserved hypothetical protein [Tenacibaculum sp. 190524A02b]|uniref:Nucleotidyltransferase n=1 Tax=Tenacibaculum vairaonense TaxID=3137860 RepID=A0ABM9PQV4_9FLAO
MLKDMIAVKQKQTALKNLNSTSKVSVWLNLLYVVLTTSNDVKSYFDEHRKEVEYSLNNGKAGTLPWYRKMALKFQYGFDLIKDTDKFDNTNATEQEIEQSKLIKYAAVNEGDKAGTIVIKIAGEESGVLAPLAPEVQNAVTAYFSEVKGAGDKIKIINYLADLLELVIDIYIDPLVLTTNGLSITEANYPVKDAINEFMKELPFNGELIIQALVDKIQKAQGVKIVHIKSIKSSWLDVDTGTYAIPSEINVKRIPESGYFKVENFNNIKYVV